MSSMTLTKYEDTTPNPVFTIECTTMTMIIMMSSRLLVALALCLALCNNRVVVHGKLIDINWEIPARGTGGYEDRTAYVDDVIEFRWTDASHNVYILPSMDCGNRDNEILVGADPGSQYTIAEDDAGKSLFFVCNVGGHCESGLHVTVKVPSSPTSGKGASGGTASSSAASAVKRITLSLLSVIMVVARVSL